MSDIRFNQWLHQSGTGGVSQVASGAVGVGTTNPLADFYVRGDAQITGILTAGHIAMGSSITFGDDDRAYFGDGTDLQIYHSGSDSFIQDTGTGDLKIRSSTVRIEDTSGNLMINASPTSAYLYSSGSGKLGTAGWGAQVNGIFKVLDASDVNGSTNNLSIGTGNDLKLYHDNNGDSYISNATGHLTIRNNTSGKVINLQPKSGANGVIARYEGASELYYNGNKKFETTNTGAVVTGIVTATTFSGAVTTTDSCQVGDLTILNGNPDLRLKDSNHGGNNTEHIITFQDSSGNNQMNIGSPYGEQHLRIKYGTTDLVKIQTDGTIGIGTATIRNSRAMQLTGASNSLFLITGHAPSICLNRDADDSSDGDRSFFGVSSVSNGFANGTAAGDTIIRGNSSGKIHLATGTSIRMSIEPAGETNFNSNVTISGDLTIPDKIIHTGDTNTAIRFPSNDTITAETNGSERLRINSDGKVGIATGTGSGLINTRHGGTNQQILHVRSDLGSSNGRSLNLYTPDTDNTEAPFRFQTGNGFLFQCDSEDVLTIRHDRKVVIGTNAAGAKLSVGGNIITDDGTNARLTLQAENTSTNQILSTTTGFGSYTALKYQAADHRFLYGGNELVRIHASSKSLQIYGGDLLLGPDSVSQMEATIRAWGCSLWYTTIDSNYFHDSGGEYRVFYNKGSAAGNNYLTCYNCSIQSGIGPQSRSFWRGAAANTRAEGTVTVPVGYRGAFFFIGQTSCASIPYNGNGRYLYDSNSPSRVSVSFDSFGNNIESGELSFHAGSTAGYDTNNCTIGGKLGSSNSDSTLRMYCVGVNMENYNAPNSKRAGNHLGISVMNNDGTDYGSSRLSENLINNSTTGGTNSGSTSGTEFNWANRHSNDRGATTTFRHSQIMYFDDVQLNSAQWDYLEHYFKVMYG